MEASRFLAISVKFVLSEHEYDQEIFREPTPFSVAVKFVGGKSGPERNGTM